MLIISVLAILVGIAATYVSTKWMRKFRREHKLIDLIPGPPALPLFGNSLSFANRSSDFYMQLERLCSTYSSSGIYRLWFGLQPAIVIFKAELNEIFFNSSKHITKAQIYELLSPWLGDGLLLSEGSKWTDRRRLLTPAFHFKILEEFVDIINEHVDVFIGIMDCKVGQEAFDIQPYIVRCMLDAICDTAMGVCPNAQTQKSSQYAQDSVSLSDLVMERIKSPWLWPERTLRFTKTGRKFYACIDRVHRFSNKVIQERSIQFDKAYAEFQKPTEAASEDGYEAPVKVKGKRLAFLDILLNAAKTDPNFTMADIQEEVDTFTFEGHDTTASTVTWFMYVMGKHTDVQEKVQIEADRVLGSEDRAVIMEDVSQLKYLECVLKETWRLYPPVPLFGRRTSEDCEIGGYVVPKGTMAFILTVPLHRDAQNFPDPEKFYPERWLNSADRHPYGYIPFSAGFRNCIGQRYAVMEAKIMLAKVMRRFNVKLMMEGEIKRRGVLVMKPEEGLIVKLSRRA